MDNRVSGLILRMLLLTCLIIPSIYSAKFINRNESLYLAKSINYYDEIIKEISQFKKEQFKTSKSKKFAFWPCFDYMVSQKKPVILLLALVELTLTIIENKYQSPYKGRKHAKLIEGFIKRINKENFEENLFYWDIFDLLLKRKICTEDKLIDYLKGVLDTIEDYYAINKAFYAKGKCYYVEGYGAKKKEFFIFIHKGIEKGVLDTSAICSF